MRFYLLLCTLVVPVLCAAEAKKYRDPAPVIEKLGLQSVVPPCKHATGYKFDTPTSALIESQTQARIVNHKNHQHTADLNLETAASGYSSQTQSAAPTNHIGSGVGIKATGYQGTTNSQGYAQNSFSTSVPKPPVNYIPVTQVQSPLSLQSQSLTGSSTQGQGYFYNQGFSSQTFRQGQPNSGPAVYPVPPRLGSVPSIPSLPSLQLSSSRPHHGLQYSGQHLTQSFGGQTSSSQFGSQIASSNFGGHPTFNDQLSASGLGGQQTTSVFGSPVASHFSSSSLFGGQPNNGAFASFPSSSVGGHGLNGHLGHVIRETVANAPLDPSADKHIYVHIPPEDLEKDNHATAIAPQFIAPPKKHYKIVFIKAPTHPTPNYGKLAAAASPKVEEKTLIYVLVKKPEQPSADDLQQLQQPSYKSSKPEVYFIKYKTDKEGDVAAHNSAFVPSGSALSTDQIEFTTSNPIEQIDIRSNGSGNEGPKHELYGVPLQ